MNKRHVNAREGGHESVASPRIWKDAKVKEDYIGCGPRGVRWRVMGGFYLWKGTKC